MQTISNFLSSRKGRDAALIALIILTATAGFGLGRLSALEEGRGRVAVTNTTGEFIGKNIEPHTSREVSAVAAAGEALDLGGKVVASKSGEVYHLPWCSGASRIKEENKVWYDSPEAAKAAGLRPAGNCKGLE